MTEPAPTKRVIIVDDNRTVRLGLRLFLDTLDEVELVGEASDGQEAIVLSTTLRPDVMLIDLKMPGIDGLTAIRTIHQQAPQIKLIALSSMTSDNEVNEVLQAGASMYLPKNVSIEVLENAIFEDATL